MTQPRVGVVGAGYVGLTTAVCLAERGRDTVCVDLDTQRVRSLRDGVAPLDEPGLPMLLRQGLDTGTLRFSDDYDDLSDRDVVFVCVPTPSRRDGSADLSAVESAVDTLVEILDGPAVIALKSTVPVGTTRRLLRCLARRDVALVSSPEFLRESHAVYDFRNPYRIVIGCDNDDDADVVEQAYGDPGTRVLRMSPESAELAKYASNAFLAVKLSYANSLARLCSRLGGEIGDVTAVMGADDRIGRHFLAPGPGWGGSCLPKDTAALLHIGARAGVELAEVRAARVTNDGQCRHIASVLTGLLGGRLSGARITALGLTFKANTSDVRDSPALRVCRQLSTNGAQVSAYDPRLSRIPADELSAAGVVAVDDPYVATKTAHAIVVLTEWPQFADLDWSMIADQAPDALVLDTRNTLDGAVIRREGLRYFGNGIPGGL